MGFLPIQEQLGGTTLGQVIHPLPPRFTPVPEHTNTYEVASGSARSVAYLPINSVSVVLDDELRVSSYTYTVRAFEEETVARSTLLVKLLCAFYSAPIEQWSPSPLGTPMEGEIWDPLYETYMECTGVRGGVELSIRAEVFEDSASDFSTVFVTRRTASTAAEPG